MARKKLRWSAFVELNQMILADLPNTFDRWHGLRVIAGDSTTLYLPTTHPDTIAASGDGFNCYHTDTGIYSLARGAALCEASTGLFLRADLASDAVGEREMLIAQLDALAPDDLLVLDRGYPAYWLFALLLKRNHHFCMRVTCSFSNEIKQFVESGADSEQVTMTPEALQRAAFEAVGLPLQAFTVRLVRVPLPSGEIEVLVTSLLDESVYPSTHFADLYHRRWRIEEAFRHIKCRLKIEQFGGETPLAIRQEFHAAILVHNLATIAAQEALAQRQELLGLFSANLTHASHLIRLHLPRLVADPPQQAALCTLLLGSVSRKITRTRPDREGPPRKKNRPKPRYHRSYK